VVNGYPHPSIFGADMAAGPEASATRLPADLAQRRVAMLNLRITLISKSPDNAGYSKRTIVSTRSRRWRRSAPNASLYRPRPRRPPPARSPGARRARGIARHRADALPFRDHRPEGRDVELALVLSDSTHADQRRAGHTPNDARPILLFRHRANSLLFDCSGIQISLIR